jgi:hypothetical protein
MKFAYITILIFLLVGCSSSQNRVEEFFQTDNATQVRRDYFEIIELLLKYKEKLDKRNPQNYDKKQAYYIEKELKNSTNTLYLAYNGKYLKNYIDYLKVAFLPTKVKNRNDFLILGIYKQLYEAYEIEEQLQVTTLTYDAEKLRDLYYALMVVNWKIKTKKYPNKEYLFITWQNNWQIELSKKLNGTEKLSAKLIDTLKHIKNKQETLLSKNNCSFEILMAQILYHINHSLKIMGEEPLDVGLEAAKSLVFFL